MANQSKQKEIINTLSLLTDEQIETLNQFIKSFVPNKTNTNNFRKLGLLKDKGKILFADDCKITEEEFLK